MIKHWDKNKFKSQIDINRSKCDETIIDNSLDQISSEIKNTSIPSFHVDDQFIASKDINDKELIILQTYPPPQLYLGIIN